MIANTKYSTMNYGSSTLLGVVAGGAFDRSGNDWFAELGKL